MSPTRTALARVDRWLGRASMYAVVALVLGALAAWSLVGAAAGRVGAAPADLAASLAVCLAAAWGANRAVALLLRAPARSASALVTGLLLYFLMWPAATARDLGAAAAAAAVATAAKYLLAVRGRRLVNPAAFGALAVGVSGLGAPVWWVANPWMLAPVLLGGALVVRRAGGGGVASVVALVGWCATSARLVGSGMAPGRAAWMALASYPVAFLAAFMATEPLTLAPRRRQQWALAALVGLLLGVPISAHVGGLALALTPEAALVVGNLAAAALAGFRGGAQTLRVAAVERIGASLVEVRLAAAAPLRFAAGQYVELTLPGVPADLRGNRRVFSVATAPEADGSRVGAAGAPELGVVFRLPARPSAFKRALAAAAPGTRLRLEGVRGDFTLPRDPRFPLLLVARGVGVTPFLSHLADLCTRGERRDVAVILVIRDAGDAGLVERLRSVAAGAGARVLVTDSEAFATAADLRRLCPDAAGRIAYASGSPAFVAAARALLRAAGVRRVRTDEFFGY